MLRVLRLLARNVRVGSVTLIAVWCFVMPAVVFADPGAELVADGAARAAEEETFRLPVLGEVGIFDRTPLVVTAVIALVDGFNPCSLWVLTMLLALVAYARSRVKTVLVGATFLVVTATTYGAFILGVFTVFAFLPYMDWIRGLTALIAASFGLVSVKEYFAPGGGLHMSLSPRQRRGIAKRFRAVLRGERSYAALIALTAAAAAGIALVELPCTAGFPVVWSGFMAARGISGGAFVALLVIYVLLYLLIEIALFAIAVIGLGVERMTEGYARVVKLFGGLFMLALAAALVFMPQAVTNIEQTLAFLAVAFAVGLAIVAVHGRRRVR